MTRGSGRPILIDIPIRALFALRAAAGAFLGYVLLYPLWVFCTAILNPRAPTATDPEGWPEDAPESSETDGPRRRSRRHRLLKVAVLSMVVSILPPFGLAQTANADPGLLFDVAIEIAPNDQSTGSTYTVTATVTDVALENPAGGVEVSFDASEIEGPNDGQPVLGDAAKTTDSEGVATTTIRSTNAGTSNVTASTIDGGIDSAPATWVPGPLARYEILTGSPRPVDTCFPVEVRALDAFDNLRTNDTSQLLLDSSSPSLLLYAATDCSTSGAQSRSLTLSGGTGTVGAESTALGEFTLTATGIGNPATGTATVTIVPGPPATVTVSPASDSNQVDTPHTVTATVTDGSGHLVGDGTEVTFTAEGTGAEDPDFEVATTTDGVATFTFTSTLTGTSTITATSGDAFGTATKLWTPGPVSTVTLTPEHATNTVGETHTVTATIRDEHGNLVTTPTVVTFTVEGQAAQGPTEKTTSGGVATFSFSSTLVGTSTVTVEVSGTALFATATKLWVADDPATVTVTPTFDDNVVGEDHVVTATATDALGNPVPGALVTFTVAGTSAETPTAGTSLTDENGQATFTFTSTLTGTSTITATSGDAFGTATKLWTPGPVSTVTLTPEHATNTVGETHTVTATIRDEHGNLVTTPTVVTFTVEGQAAQGPTEKTTSGGVATFSFSSTLVGTSTVTVEVSGTALSATATKLWVADDPATVTVTPTFDDNVVGQDHVVTATVTDTFGNRVPGALVTFTVAGTGGETPTMGTAITDENGQATFTFTSTLTGTSTITATSGEAFGTATKQWTPGPLDHYLVEAVSPQAAGDCFTITVTARDEFGNFVPSDTSQAFLQSSSDDGDSDLLFYDDPACTTGETSEKSVFLDGGVATTTASGSDTEQVTVTASEVGGDAQGSTTIDIIGDEPATVTVTPAHATNTVGDPHPVTATVTDGFGEAVQDGTVVTFTTGGTGGEDPDFETATTTDGAATFTFTSTRTGTSTITATAGGVFGTATKTWLSDVAHTVTVTPTFSINFVDDPHTVTATVLNEPGDPLAGAVVTFTVGGTGGEDPTFGTATTNADGQATFTFTSGRSGTSTVVAQADGESDTAQKRWVCHFPSAFSYMAFSRTFDGGIFVAMGDVDGDGCDEAIVGTGPGTAGRVRAFDADGSIIRDFSPYGPFDGGVRVGAADVNGDGFDDIITGPGAGGGPHVKVFNGRTGGLIHSFMAFDTAFRGGVFVAGGNVDASGGDDIVVGAGAGGGPHVKVLRGSNLGVLHSFFAYPAGFSGGVQVAAGNVNGSGGDDIITGAGPGGGPHVKVFRSSDRSVLHSFFAFSSAFRGGVFVASGDFDGDGKDDIVAGAGAGGGPHVKIFSGDDRSTFASFFAYNPAFRGGVRVGSGDYFDDDLADLITGPGSGGGPHVQIFF